MGCPFTRSDPALPALSAPPCSAQWARLPGLATSLELVHALTTQMCVALALATRLRTGQHFSTPLVLHWLHTMAQPQVRRAGPLARVRCAHGLQTAQRCLGHRACARWSPTSVCASTLACRRPLALWIST